MLLSRNFLSPGRFLPLEGDVRENSIMSHWIWCHRSSSTLEGLLCCVTKPGTVVKITDNCDLSVSENCVPGKVSQQSSSKKNWKKKKITCPCLLAVVYLLWFYSGKKLILSLPCETPYLIDWVNVACSIDALISFKLVRLERDLALITAAPFAAALIQQSRCRNVCHQPLHVKN